MQLARRFTDKRPWQSPSALCWVAALAVTGSTGVLLFMAPALLIAIPLLGGHYIGEELIAELAERRARPPRRAASASAYRCRRHPRADTRAAPA